MGDTHVLSTDPDLLSARVPAGARLVARLSAAIWGYFLSAPVAKNATERGKSSVFEPNGDATREAAAKTNWLNELMVDGGRYAGADSQSSRSW